MNTIKYFLLLPVLACGVAPHDAALSLDAVLASPEDWCGWKEPEVDKNVQIPDDYGITSTYGCDDNTAWPGGFCLTPGDLHQRWRLFQGSQDAVWFQDMTDEFGGVQSRMNARGWDISRVSTGTIAQGTVEVEVRTGTTNGGLLGMGNPMNWITVQDPLGAWRLFGDCEVYLYRTTIEANQFYQAASPTQKYKYRKNLWDHEMSHCTGLSHDNETDELMSDVYYFPGPRFDSLLNPMSDDLADLEAYAD
jgi:hypothetical protein